MFHSPTRREQETSFIKTPLKYLQWSHRLPLILKEIIYCKPDVVCLQEVDCFNDIHIDGYDAMFLPKTNSPCCQFIPNNGPDGCAIMYNTSSVNLLTRKDFTLHNEYNQPSSQVALLAEFSFNGGHNICVGTTHLKAKSGFEKQRYAQGMEVLKHMKEFSSESKPFVICGDFNAVPTEPVYHGYSSTTQSPLLKSAYSEYTGKDPLFTTMKYRENGLSKYTGDYIWYDSDQLRVSRLYDLLTEPIIGDNGLPSQYYPSDHMALCAELQIK